MVYDEDGMGRYRQVILDVCEELIAANAVTSLKNWCDKAGISESSVRNFLNGGRSTSLALKSYLALAAVANRPVSALLGEDVPQTETERLILQGYRAAPKSGKAALEAQALRELEGQKESSR